jgi:hypothetical protein
VPRWIRFIAGFSGAWAQHLIQCSAEKRETRVFDPFAGSGTALIAAEDAGVPSFGVEAHPFVYRLARAKLARRYDPAAFGNLVKSVRASAGRRKPEIDHYPKLIRACYSDEPLGELDRLRRAVEDADDGSGAAQLVWLALVSILRRCSHAGTAQWQYVLPKKSKKSPARPLVAFEQQARMMLADMASAVVDTVGKENAFFVNFLLEVDWLCDCEHGERGWSDLPIVPDLGVAASADPVALDMASTELVNNAPGMPGSRVDDASAMKPGADKFKAIFPNMDWKDALTACERLGIGRTTYKLVKVD